MHFHVNGTPWSCATRKLCLHILRVLKSGTVLFPGIHDMTMTCWQENGENTLSPMLYTCGHLSTEEPYCVLPLLTAATSTPGCNLSTHRPHQVQGGPRSQKGQLLSPSLRPDSTGPWKDFTQLEESLTHLLGMFVMFDIQLGPWLDFE